MVMFEFQLASTGERVWRRVENIVGINEILEEDSLKNVVRYHYLLPLKAVIHVKNPETGKVEVFTSSEEASVLFLRFENCSRP